MALNQVVTIPEQRDIEPAFVDSISTSMIKDGINRFTPGNNMSGCIEGITTRAQLPSSKILPPEFIVKLFNGQHRLFSVARVIVEKIKEDPSIINEYYWHIHIYSAGEYVTLFECLLTHYLH